MVKSISLLTRTYFDAVHGAVRARNGFFCDHSELGSHEFKKLVPTSNVGWVGRMENFQMLNACTDDSCRYIDRFLTFLVEEFAY